MIAIFTIDGTAYKADLSRPLDLSIALEGDVSNVNAWYVEHPRIAPHRSGDFIGSIKEGASTNFNDIWFNPHAHGTHTECVGHILPEGGSVNDAVTDFFHKAQVITVAPSRIGEDRVISKKQLHYALNNVDCKALVIRTLPNTTDKKSRQYSHTNPPYLLEEAMAYVVSLGIEHILVDLPSVDKEVDGGKLAAHKAFWQVAGDIREHCSITEFIYVPIMFQMGPICSISK